MITATQFSIEESLIIEARSNFPKFDGKITLNQPTKSFFNDPWVIKNDFKNSVWNKILNSLDTEIGEARLIRLKPGECYLSHADIDDRWHLNIQGENSFLIDLDNKNMYETTTSRYWYKMDASKKHSAANFGSYDRIQLVVRTLLNNNIIKDPISVKIVLKKPTFDRRYVFDQVLSSWFNLAYKQGIISDFYSEDLMVSLVIEKNSLYELKSLASSHFDVIICNGI